MSDKNFMSYEDAAEVLGTFAERIKDDEYENITYEQWLAKTDEQKEAGNFLVSGVPNADGKVTIEGCKRLWINPSGNVEFAAQTVDLDLGTYDMVLVTYYNACTAVAYVGSNGRTDTCQTFNGRLINEDRIMSVSVVGVTFQDCYRHQQTSAGSQFTDTVFNTSCVPAAIYGIKLNHQLEIQAIARDVSTSADKCMLSDGETSVEDIIPSAASSLNQLADKAYVDAQESRYLGGARHNGGGVGGWNIGNITGTYKVPYVAADFDGNTDYLSYDASTSTFTIKKAGTYRIDTFIRFWDQTAQQFTADNNNIAHGIYVNGSAGHEVGNAQWIEIPTTCVAHRISQNHSIIKTLAAGSTFYVGGYIHTATSNVRVTYAFVDVTKV